ncbi:hypothetical protein BH20VER1_BH20VER1_03290 [soil metagenome]
MGNTIKDMLPATERRVIENSAEHINEENCRRIEQNVARYAGASPAQIERRIRELEEEWDTERALATGAALNAGFGLAMGAFVDRRWYAWSGVVLAFLLQHSLQGWCPPLPIMRRLGVRATAEIDEEKTALRILRGDFNKTDDPAEAVAQVRRGASIRTGNGGSSSH